LYPSRTLYHAIFSIFTDIGGGQTIFNTAKCFISHFHRIAMPNTSTVGVANTSRHYAPLTFFPPFCGFDPNGCNWACLGSALRPPPDSPLPSAPQSKTRRATALYRGQRVAGPPLTESLCVDFAKWWWWLHQFRSASSVPPPIPATGLPDRRVTSPPPLTPRPLPGPSPAPVIISGYARALGLRRRSYSGSTPTPRPRRSSPPPSPSAPPAQGPPPAPGPRVRG